MDTIITVILTGIVFLYAPADSDGTVRKISVVMPNSTQPSVVGSGHLIPTHFSYIEFDMRDWPDMADGNPNFAPTFEYVHGTFSDAYGKPQPKRFGVVLLEGQELRLKADPINGEPLSLNDTKQDFKAIFPISGFTVPELRKGGQESLATRWPYKLIASHKKTCPGCATFDTRHLTPKKGDGDVTVRLDIIRGLVSANGEIPDDIDGANEKCLWEFRNQPIATNQLPTLVLPQQVTIDMRSRLNKLTIEMKPFGGTDNDIKRLTLKPLDGARLSVVIGNASLEGFVIRHEHTIEEEDHHWEVYHRLLTSKPKKSPYPAQKTACDRNLGGENCPPTKEP